MTLKFFLPNKIYLPNLNHKMVLVGGQTFSWELLESAPNPNLYIGRFADRIVLLQIKDPYIYWQTYPKTNDTKFIHTYFNLNLNFKQIEQIISRDKYVAKAIGEYKRIIILKQPFWETVASFITSANNNIKRIRKIYLNLASKFGTAITIPQLGKIHLFPSLNKIASLSIEQLRAVGLGYRAKYLKESANILLSLQQKIIKNKNTGKARDLLLTLPGVGNKVADCILVFSLGEYSITPIDLWVKRILTTLYGLPKNKNYQFYRNFFKHKFNGYGAFAGQYLFEYFRTNKAH